MMKPVADRWRPVDSLRNLGPQSRAMLREAGIETVGDLCDIGAAEAWHWVRLTRPNGVSVNLLYALHAALDDIPWRAITAEDRARWLAGAGLDGRN